MNRRNLTINARQHVSDLPGRLACGLGLNSVIRLSIASRMPTELQHAKTHYLNLCAAKVIGCMA